MGVATPWAKTSSHVQLAPFGLSFGKVWLREDSFPLLPATRIDWCPFELACGRQARRAADEAGTGEARALMSGGGAFAQLLRGGQWRGRAARFYLDLNGSERRAMADILNEGSGDEPL